MDFSRYSGLDIPAFGQSDKAKVLLKREDLQPVHSFKLRGAYNKIANLTGKKKLTW